MKWSYCFLQNTDSVILQEVYTALDITRKLHIDRIKNADAKRRSLQGELLIKELLQKEFNVKNPIICQDKNGRPYVKNSDIFISIAHSNDLVVAAADFKSVGIDVEKLKPNSLKAANRFCLPNEKEYIFKNADLSLYRFYEVWTAKEAYFKKMGTGITNLKSVDILSLDRHIFDIEDYLIQIV